MENKRFVATLATLVLAAVALTQGFTTYAKKTSPKLVEKSMDGQKRVTIEKKEAEHTFVVREEGTIQQEETWSGGFCNLLWAKDNLQYVITYEEQGKKNIAIVHSGSPAEKDGGELVKKAITEYIALHDKGTAPEEGGVSLEAQSWCEDSKALYLKYEIDKQYAGYVIWNQQTKKIEAIYEM